MQVSKSLHVLWHDVRVPVPSGRELVRFVYSLLLSGDSITLVDSGVKGGQDAIYDYIQGQGRKIEEISTLILSHSHPDHIGSASSIKALTGCKVLAHRPEQAWIERPELQNRERPVPGFFDLVDGPGEADGGRRSHVALLPHTGALEGLPFLPRLKRSRW